MEKLTNLKVGKLYCCPKYLLIFPSIEKARSAGPAAARASTAAVAAAQVAVDWAAYYWSRELDCKVKYSNPNDIFIVLEVKEFKTQIYLNCLFKKFSGWIVYNNKMGVRNVLDD